MTYPTPTNHTDFERTYAELGKVVVGQEHLIKQLFIAMFTGRHVLLEGAPGAAKTLTVSIFATVMGGSYSRIQLTPDLMPSDTVGTRIFHQDTSEFIVEPDLVMSNIVFTDKIDRASAKVQSVLPEVMIEHQVSIAGESTPVLESFLVLAIQNPVENQGVYPLPEAQRDRFLFKVLAGYPIPAEERETVYRMGATPPAVQQIPILEGVRELQHATCEVSVHHTLTDYTAAVIEFTRDPMRTELKDAGCWLPYGASPRAIFGAAAVAHTYALFSDHDYVVPDNVVPVLPGVLRRCLILSYEGSADGVTFERIIGIMLSHVCLPQGAGTGSDEDIAS